jgi:hypothetical protein
MAKRGGYLKKIKEENPEKLKAIQKKGVEKRQKKAELKRTFKDIYNGLLDAVVVLKDRDGNIVKDKDGKLIELTQKEALAMQSIENLKNNVSLRDVREIMEIIGEVNTSQNNDIINGLGATVRNEIDLFSFAEIKNGISNDK